MKNKKQTIKEMPVFERPFEKCLSYGAAALTDSELLAIILRTGTQNADALELARDIVSLDLDYGLNNLLHKTIYDYMSLDGIGKVKAVQLVCIAEISKRMWRRETINKRNMFSSPANCASYYMQELRNLEQEELRVVFLDTKMRMLSDAMITKGSIDSSILSIRDIMIEAIKRKAVNIILVHNHPSGVPSPSKEDIEATRRVKEACSLIGLGFGDHIIIGDNQYYSFKEWGKL